MRVLLIEDSYHLRETVGEALRRSGFAVDLAADGTEGYRLAIMAEYDLIILDLMLPGIEGLPILKRLRDRGNRTGVLILTARDAVANRIEGLRAGADDYLVKPFDLDELLARVQAVGRRSDSRPSMIVRVGEVEIDMAARVVRRSGESVALAAREYALLEFLAMRRNSIVTRSEIERRLYSDPREIASNVVDSTVCTLRRKLDPPDGPSTIKTRRGIGYVLGEEN